jgi:hypothetical protein
MYLIFVTSLTWYIFTRFGGVLLNQERREEGDGGGTEVRFAIAEGIYSIVRGSHIFFLSSDCVHHLLRQLARTGRVKYICYSE